MKLLALNGSHKKAGGNTQRILENLMLGAQQSGAETETVRLSECNMLQCIACDACQKRYDYGCIHDEKDDFLKIVNKCREADIIIYATPIYVFQMSSKLKIFLERIYSRGKSDIKTFSKANLLFHNIEQDVFSKPFISVITASNVERETTLSTERYFEAFSLFMDAPHVGSIVRNGCSILFDNNNRRSKRKLQKILYDTQGAGKFLSENEYISRYWSKQIGTSVLPLPLLLYRILKRTKVGRERILDRSNCKNNVESSII
jgi:multimeric flavodoxin WrbA